MAAVVYNFTIEQGATFRKTITWKDAVGNPVNLTNYTAKMQLRDKIGGTIFAELTTTSGITINSTQGQITLYISATNTAAITVKKLVYDLDLVSPTGDVTRLIKGKATVEVGVTV